KPTPSGGCSFRLSRACPRGFALICRSAASQPTSGGTVCSDRCACLRSSFSSRLSVLNLGQPIVQSTLLFGLHQHQVSIDDSKERQSRPRGLMAFRVVGIPGLLERLNHMGVLSAKVVFNKPSEDFEHALIDWGHGSTLVTLNVSPGAPHSLHFSRRATSG